MKDLWQTTLLQNPLLWLLLTLATYQAGVWLYNRCGRRVIVHPIATSAPLIALLLSLCDVPYRDYVDANQLLYFLLGPTTVALAVPLYREFHLLRRLALPVLVTVLVGSAVAALSAVGVAWLLGANKTVLLSLAPRSVTTPIAISLADTIGGLTTLATGVVVFTGVIGTLFAPLVFYLLRLRDPRQQGVVLGLNAHGIGTARCFETDPVAGAFATLSMGLTGAFTALTLPYAVQLF